MLRTTNEQLCWGRVSKYYFLLLFLFSTITTLDEGTQPHVHFQVLGYVNRCVRRYEQAGDLNHAVLRMTSTHHTVR